MLRISLVEENHAAVRLRLEGNIAGPWVDELKNACLQMLGEGRRPELNLAGVTFADHQGVALLSTLSAKGIKLLECSPFVSEQIKRG